MSNRKTGCQPTKFTVMKYNNLELGTIEAMVNKLGGMNGVKDFLSNKTQVLDVSQDVYFRVWKKINIGVHQNLDELYTSLIFPSLRIRSNMTHWGYDMDKIVFGTRPVLSPENKEVKLINTSPVGLGFKNRFFTTPSLGDVCNKAQRNGLLLCSEEMAFELTLQYKEREFKRIYIPTRKGVFDLSRSDKELYLSIYDQAPTTVYQKHDRFIFCLPG